MGKRAQKAINYVVEEAGNQIGKEQKLLICLRGKGSPYVGNRVFSCVGWNSLDRLALFFQFGPGAVHAQNGRSWRRETLWPDHFAKGSFLLQTRRMADCTFWLNVLCFDEAFCSRRNNYDWHDVRNHHGLKRMDHNLAKSEKDHRRCARRRRSGQGQETRFFG